MEAKVDSYLERIHAALLPDVPSPSADGDRPVNPDDKDALPPIYLDLLIDKLTQRYAQDKVFI